MTEEKKTPLLLTRIANASQEVRLPRKLLTELLDLAYRKEKRRGKASLDLVVMDDDEIARLNRRHLGRDRATDVLAFDDGEMEPGGRLRLGDVAISAETARRVSAERDMKFNHELAFYALHGLLHLLGMRDGSDEEREAMHRRQADIMRAYGLEVGDELM
jgi:metalloprotein, YbeY/UPF0054 family